MGLGLHQYVICRKSIRAPTMTTKICKRFRIGTRAFPRSIRQNIVCDVICIKYVGSSVVFFIVHSITFIYAQTTSGRLATKMNVGIIFVLAPRIYFFGLHAACLFWVFHVTIHRLYMYIQYTAYNVYNTPSNLCDNFVPFAIEYYIFWIWYVSKSSLLLLSLLRSLGARQWFTW